ncbi:hypothetical protein GDO81_012213 [Engystomops pustulosus]|uniref:Uncharacterized protein n=1 Tax=Engystomops pustulosus TaxID=76066 RepID=A0AAV7BJR5_ENGPU|nr:hypothetical protein GDO81_012213 [Engystomops pustulosus]
MRIVVSVLRVHWLLFQAFAHVAGIVISDAENSLTGSNAPGPSSSSETTIPDSKDVLSGVLSLNVFFIILVFFLFCQSLIPIRQGKHQGLQI